ncbi:phosphoserine aminotransferase [Alphaproteobacteria bacterium]|nr:phosphoserine aminotransferase [Alphaproteobacteria bacterium]GHS96855.1 phosphoserine aminotransferase [Alphaproteobacteria bacterium]
MKRSPSLPQAFPQNIKFGSGPTAKINKEERFFDESVMGRSHRSVLGLQHIQKILASLRSVLQIPPSYEIALTNGSGTGAMEMLLWNLLGPKPVDVFSAGIFGQHWLHDVQEELKLPTHSFSAPVGQNPDFSRYHPDHDGVCVWVETPSGTAIPHADWVPSERAGLVVCDATAALFSGTFPWEKMDAVAFSWQKGLGGEAGIGTIVLSPRALARLNAYTPPWPNPRLFRIPFTQNAAGQKEVEDLFWQGRTINTISLLTIQDMQSALDWAEKKGSLPGLLQRVQGNYEAIKEWVQKTPWADFLVEEEENRAKNVLCLRLKDPQTQQSAAWPLLKKIAQLLEQKNVAVDILNHAFSTPALRIWAGPVIETKDLRALMGEIEWTYAECCKEDSLQLQEPRRKPVA